jgi:hypothetical protein
MKSLSREVNEKNHQNMALKLRKRCAKYRAPATGQKRPSPFIIRFVMVQGVNFTCMAYRDENGRWRNAQNNDELPQPVRVLK